MSVYDDVLKTLEETKPTENSETQEETPEKSMFVYGDEFSKKYGKPEQTKD